MLKVWILVFFPSTGEPIQVAAFDDMADCREVAYFMARDLQPDATVSCEAGE